MSLADDHISEAKTSMDSVAEKSVTEPVKGTPRAKKTASTSRPPARRGRPPKAKLEKAEPKKGQAETSSETPNVSESITSETKTASSSKKTTTRSTTRRSSTRKTSTRKSAGNPVQDIDDSREATVIESVSSEALCVQKPQQTILSSPIETKPTELIKISRSALDTAKGPISVEQALKEASKEALKEASKPAPKRRGRKPKAVVEAELVTSTEADGASDRFVEDAAVAQENLSATVLEQNPTEARISTTRGRRRVVRINAEEKFQSEQVNEASESEDKHTDNQTNQTQESTEHKTAYEYVNPDVRPGRSSRNSKHVSTQKSDTHRTPRPVRESRESRDNRDRRNQDTNSHRRQRRAHAASTNREPVVPKTTAEDLALLKVAELRAKAAELEIDVKGLKKAELIEKVLEASLKAEGFIEVEGILDILQDGYGFLRTSGYLPGENDVYVGLSVIRRNSLRKGDYIRGQVRPARENEKYAALQQIITVNDVPLDEMGRRVRFGDLTPVFPDELLKMEHGKQSITARVIDLVAPIGKGQRGLIVSPPKAGKTTILKDIAASITTNNPEVHLMCLLVDERPEEVTDMQRSIKGEVIASTFDMPIENHIAVSELVIERAKRLVENGGDVVILLDSLTRLARAYNLAQPASGRILSGGVDSTALYPPKRFLGAARNIENGGSLTILASALIETGSKMDEVIFEEFKGTGNMELKLDRYLADRRIFPAIDPITSGTRKEELLLDSQEAPLVWGVRSVLSGMNSTDKAMNMLIRSLKKTDNNVEFLMLTAKKAQAQQDSEVVEF